MMNISYTHLQKKYPGKLIAILEPAGKVVAAGKNAQDVEKTLQKRGVDPKKCLFLGPVKQYNQISVY